MLRSIGKAEGRKSTVIGLKQYRPLAFESETTNQKAYQGFRISAKPKVQTQKVEAVMSKALPSHFDTYNKKEFVKHDYKVS